MKIFFSFIVYSWLHLYTNRFKNERWHKHFTKQHILYVKNIALTNYTSQNYRSLFLTLFILDNWTSISKNNLNSLRTFLNNLATDRGDLKYYLLKIT